MNTDSLEDSVRLYEQKFLDVVGAYLTNAGVSAVVEVDHGKPHLVFPEWTGDDGFTVSFETEGYERALNIVPFAADRFPSLPIHWPAQTALCITRWIEVLERERLLPRRAPVPQKSTVPVPNTRTTEEWITSNVHNDAWKCICGNDAMSDGFAGVQVVMVNQSVGDSKFGDTELVICQRCGRLIDPDTHEVNPIDTFDEYETHRVKVVGQYPEDRISTHLFDLTPEPPQKSPQEWGPWGPEGRQDD